MNYRAKIVAEEEERRLRREAFDSSPGARLAYRIMLEEIRDMEIDIARKQCRLLQLKAGVHPQQKLVEATLDWEAALKSNYGPALSGHRRDT